MRGSGPTSVWPWMARTLGLSMMAPTRVADPDHFDHRQVDPDEPDQLPGNESTQEQRPACGLLAGIDVSSAVSHRLRQDLLHRHHTNRMVGLWEVAQGLVLMRDYLSRREVGISGRVTIGHKDNVEASTRRHPNPAIDTELDQHAGADDLIDTGGLRGSKRGRSYRKHRSSACVRPARALAVPVAAHTPM